jgi:hypothetical protein
MTSRARCQACFFLRSAQRFFIISDRRFLPAGVSPRPRFVLEAVAAAALGGRPLRAVGACDSSRPIALPMRSISCLNSATIFSRSNIVPPAKLVHSRKLSNSTTLLSAIVGRKQNYEP